MHTLHLPPGHLVHATVVAALTAILAAVIVALAAERLAPSDTVVTSTEVRAAAPAAPRAQRRRPGSRARWRR